MEPDRSEPNDSALLDDGAAEVVTRGPRRIAKPPKGVEEVSRAPAGGHMQRMLEAGVAHRRDYILLRKADQPATRITLPHAEVFKMLWRLWQAKRVANAEDPGVTIAEVGEALAAEGSAKATSSVSSAMRALARSGATRVITAHVGFRSQRSRYYPSQGGVEAFALAEVLGDGSMVQVGRTSRAWTERNHAEPHDLFQHARLLRGWTEPVESA